MTLVLACAIGVTLGVALLTWALVPRVPSLAAELDELLSPQAIPVAEPNDFWDAFGRSLLSTLDPDGAHFPQLFRDLSVTGETSADFARQVLTTAALFAVLAVAVFAAIAVEGFHLPAVIEVGLTMLTAALGAAVPRATVRSQASERRDEMREAVAVICDLAAVLVAAGEDVDGALAAAAGAGAGWAFEVVRASLPGDGRQGAWVALERLGERLGVEELTVLAQNMGLAEEKGAKVREALNTQAKTLREEAASEVEARAGSMTERMSFPMVMLLAGFLLVIGYPAVARL
jgi:tight adherence protein C